MRRRRLCAFVVTLLLLGAGLLVLASWGRVSAASAVLSAFGDTEEKAASRLPEDGLDRASVALFPVDASEVVGLDADERLVCIELGDVSLEEGWKKVDARLVGAGWKEVPAAGTEVSRTYRQGPGEDGTSDDDRFAFVVLRRMGSGAVMALMSWY